MKKFYCAACEKCMTPENGASMIGVSLQIYGDEDEKFNEFLQKQLGKFKINHTYNICYECWLTSLGVKE